MSSFEHPGAPDMPETPSSSPHQSIERSLRAAAGVSIMTLTMCLSIANIATSDNESDNPSSQATEAQSDLPFCGNASGAARSAVTAMLTKNSALNKTDYRPIKPRYTAKDTHTTGYSYSAELIKSAKKLGFTMHNGDTYLEEQGLYFENDNTFDYSLEAVTKIAEKYEITTSLATTPDERNGITPLTEIHKQDRLTRRAMNNIILAITELPVEYFKENDITHLVIADLGKNTAGKVYNDNGISKVVIDPTSDAVRKYRNTEVMLHEFEHQADHKYLETKPGCRHPGTVHRDDEFASYNKTKTYYGDKWPDIDQSDPGKPLALDHLSGRIDGEVEHKEAWSIAERCKIVARYATDAERVSIISGYGMKSVGEDKADLGAEVIAGNPKIYDKRKPVLRAKATELLARMYERSPRMAAFFINKTDLNTPNTYC